MEDQRDQQPPSSSQPMPSAPTPQIGTASASPGPAYAAADPSARLSRLLLRRAARGLIVAGQVIRPHLGWVLLTMFLLGVIGLQSIALVAPLFLAKVSDNRPPAIPTSAAVEDFLTGQSRYDADMMWESFSPLFQAALIDQGTSKDDLAARMQSDRSGGKKYTGFAYVGGLALPNDERMYFYAVDVQIDQTNQRGTFSFAFTVDKSGKIINIQ